MNRVYAAGVRSVGLAVLCALALGIVLVPGCTLPGGRGVALRASPEAGRLPLKVAFRISSSPQSGQALERYVLDFGDGSVAAEGTDLEAQVAHVYTSLGAYQARVTAFTSDGETRTASAWIRATDSSVAEGSEPGQLAYDFRTSATDGSEVMLSAFRGQVVVIDFWGAWCPHCRESLPHLVDLWEEYREEGLVLLLVSTDGNRQTSVRYLQENGYSDLACLWESGGMRTRLAKLYGVTAVPHAIVIDKAGIVRYSDHPLRLTDGLLRNLIAK